MLTRNPRDDPGERGDTPLFCSSARRAASSSPISEFLTVKELAITSLIMHASGCNRKRLRLHNGWRWRPFHNLSSRRPASTSPSFLPLISLAPVPKSPSLGRLVPALNAKVPFSSTMPRLTSRCCRHKFHKLDNLPRCLLSSALLLHRLRVLATRAVEDVNLRHVFEIGVASQTHRPIAVRAR